MSHPLPNKIDPLRLADQGVRLEGILPIAQMKRLSELLVRDDGQVQISLEFLKDDMAQRLLTGSIEAELYFVCERCSEPVKITLKIQPMLCPLLSERQLPQCPKAYEPLITEGEALSLIELVEDELLLNMPMIPKHPENKCPKPLPDFLH